MGRLDGEVAIVSGSTSGLGAEIARLFAAEGAAVLVTGRDEGRGGLVASSVTDNGGQASFVAADLADPEAAATLVDTCGVVLGPPTILVNNAVGHIGGDGAGVGVPDELLLPLSLLLHADTTAAAHSAMAPTLTRTERG